MFDSDVLKWHLEAGVDADFLRDLAEIRLAIGPLTASLAASCRTDADLKLMRSCLSMVDGAGLQAHACAEMELASCSRGVGRDAAFGGP